MDKGLKFLAEEYFPERLKEIALKHAASPERTEEIRLNAGYGITVLKRTGLYFLSEEGECVEEEKAACFRAEEIKEIIKRICENSVYSYQEQIKKGYIPLKGGHRAGVTGRCVREGDEIKYMTDFTSVTIRISHEVIGASDFVFPYIYNGEVKNTLIISPPGCGKTTILRDLARKLGSSRCMKKVSLVDERGEIAASSGGVIHNNVGSLTSVIDNAPKPEGIMCVLRAMNPDVIITDEIGTKDDAKAIMSGVLSGSKVICSAHGKNLSDVSLRYGTKELIRQKVFERIIVLSRREGPGTIEEIIKL